MAAGQTGGNLFTAPFELGTTVPSTGTNAINLDHLLGLEITAGTKTYRLVKTHGSAFAWYGRVAKWSDDDNYVITPATAATDRVAGVGDNLLGTSESVPASSYMFVHIHGRCSVIHGDDTGNYATATQYVTADNDADTGKIVDGGTTYTEGVTFAIAKTTATAVDEVIEVEIVSKLPATL